MSRKGNWNQKPPKDKDGKYRKETKEERKVRLKRQEEAREKCLKILPVAALVVLLLVLVFGILVSVISRNSSEQAILAEKKNVSHTNNGNAPVGPVTATPNLKTERTFAVEIEGAPHAGIDKTVIMEAAKAALKDHLQKEHPFLTEEQAEAKAKEFMKGADFVNQEPRPEIYDIISAHKSSLLAEQTDASSSESNTAEAKESESVKSADFVRPQPVETSEGSHKRIPGKKAGPQSIKVEPIDTSSLSHGFVERADFVKSEPGETREESSKRIPEKKNRPQSIVVERFDASSSNNDGSIEL